MLWAGARSTGFLPACGMATNTDGTPSVDEAAGTPPTGEQKAGTNRLRGYLRRRRRWWLVAGLGAVLLALPAGLALLVPGVAAGACPRCYGFVPLEADGGAPGQRVYVPRGLPAGERQRVTDLVSEANRRVGDFYGSREAAPRVLACPTDRCYRRIGGGGERGAAILNRFVMLSPLGLDPAIAAHEMSHVELRARLGRKVDRVPRWFNEGLAVLVSGDPRYLAPEPAADRCLRREPGAATDRGAGERFYAESACRVSRWVAANGGPAAVHDLIRRLDAGEEFTAIVPG